MLDILAELLLRWKTILLLVFLGTIPFGSHAVFFKSGDSLVTEAEGLLGHSALNQVFIPGRKNLLSRPAAVLRGVDRVDPEEKVKMITADLVVLADKNGWKSMWFFVAESDPNAFSFAERVRKELSAKRPNIPVQVGDPLASSGSLEALAGTDSALAFIELAESKRRLLQQWHLLFSRHRIASAGFVAVRLFWN